MQGLNLDSSRWTLFNNVIVIALSLYSFATQNYKMDDSSFFQSLMVELLAPIQQGTTSIQDTISNSVEHYIKIVNTSKENVELKKTIATLENKIFSLNEVQKENNRLKQLLEFGKVIPKKKVLAQVISWDASSEFRVLRINKGSSDGLKVLAPVITMTGLVGYVYRISPNYSDILTILDQNNRVDAIVAKSRTHGIVEGHTGLKCKMKYVARTEELQEGDTIITAGLGEIYPKGIKVGHVEKIDKENMGITQRVEVKPSVDFQRLEEVVVLIEGVSGVDYQEPENQSLEENMSKELPKNSEAKKKKAEGP